MKKKILTATTLIIGTAVYAVTLGIEPPVQYINNLKTCTKSTIKQGTDNISEYTIKGKHPNGRCEVYISNYTNFADPKVYEGFTTMAKAFAQMANDMTKDNSKKITDADIPTQEQMIEQGKKEKDEMICKFSEKERNALYYAYQKHDNQNTDSSFDTSKMSSYDKLMFKYNNGPCTSVDKPGETLKEKTFACEYADTTCYVKEYDSGKSYSCTNGDVDFKKMNIIGKHVDQGMCEQIF